jgi:hypothetical protein
VLVAWCEARGLELARASEHDTLLHVELEPGNEGGELVLERDGWRASGRGTLPELGEGAEREVWLAARTPAGATLPVVRFGPGLIGVGLRELGEPAGDPALFALSWARLFDRAALLPLGVVPLAERRSAGASVRVPGTPPPPEGSAGADPGPVTDALLALGALLTASFAGLARLRSSGGWRVQGGKAPLSAAGHP